MADEDVTLGIKFQLDQSTKVIADLEKQVGSLDKRIFDLQKGANNSSSVISKAFTSIGAAAGIALAYFSSKAVVDFFESGIDAANAQQKALGDLTQQLKLTGSFSQDALDGFAAFADKMESTTNISDDVVLSQISIAKSFDLTNEEAQKLVEAAIDLSAATGVSLDGAVQNLGKTFSGTTGKLEKQIPALQNLTKEQLASGDALKIVIDRFGGTAQARINTFAGKLEGAKNAFGNLQESIGKIIIENPVLIKSIGLLSDAFKIIQKFVEDNTSVINDFVSIAIKSIVVAVPVAIDVLGFFIRALQGLASVGTLAFGGLLEVVSLFGSGFQKAIEIYVGAYVAFIQTIIDGIDEIPGLSKALNAIGIDTQGAAEGIEKLGLRITDTVSSGVDSINQLRDSTIKFAATNAEKFEKFNEGFDNFSRGVDNAVQGVFDADEKIIDNSKKTTDKLTDEEKRRKARIAAVLKEQNDKNLEESKKLRDEAFKFLDDVTTKSLDEIAKINKAREDQIAKLTEYQDKGVINAQQAADARVAIEKTAAEQIAKINEDNYKKTLADAAKANADYLAKREKESQALGGAGVGIFSGTAGEIATKSLSTALRGKEGAKDFAAQGIGTISNLVLPGYGEAIAGIASQLSVGPEQAKAMVKEFIESMPEIIDAMAEAFPVVVETLVDSLINEGGIVKIAAALVEALLFVPTFSAIGEQIGIELGGTLLEFLGTGFGKIFDYFRDQFGADVKNAFLSVFNPFIDFFKNFKIQTPAWIRDLGNVFGKTPGWIQKLLDAIDKLTNAFGGGDGSGGFFGKLAKGNFSGAGSDFEKKTRSIFGFAEGGVVPDGYPNDSYPALLSSKERVLSPKETSALDELIAKGGMGQDLTPLIVILSQISQQLENQKTSVDLKLNGDVLAKAILNQNRRGARLTA